jgi:hypothetical protein
MVFVPGEIGTEQLYVPAEIVPATPLQETLATPESASETLPLTETGEPFTLAPFAGAVMLNGGGVLSIFSVVVTLAVAPVESVAVAEKD